LLIRGDAKRSILIRSLPASKINGLSITGAQAMASGSQYGVEAAFGITPTNFEPNGHGGIMSG
jgi:hypothetical protein